MNKVPRVHPKVQKQPCTLHPEPQTLKPSNMHETKAKTVLGLAQEVIVEHAQGDPERTARQTGFRVRGLLFLAAQVSPYLGDLYELQMKLLKWGYTEDYKRGQPKGTFRGILGV